MTHTAKLALTPAYVLFCLCLGGASAAGFWANMVLQLLALPIILWAMMVERDTPMSGPARHLIALMIGVVAVILLQLIPLPPAVWSSLPGRAPIADGFSLLGVDLPWLPLSLAPRQTVASALWLLPAVATLLAILRLGFFKPHWIAWVIVATTMAGVLVGALQVASGDPYSSPWYFYEITNYGFATGFFSNANHMATLLLTTLPFLTALYLKARGRAASARQISGQFVILVGALTIVCVGIVINSSLAGIGLAVPVLAASLLMIRSSRRPLPKWAIGVVAMLAAASIYLVFSAPFGNNLFGTEAKTSEFSRHTSFSISLDAAADYFPIGSGLGTFVEIYPSYEDPAAVGRTFMNHVHSDFIELLLETGLVGVVLVGVFLLWWLRRAVRIWSAGEADHFARAATVASAAILAHSIVDYPLRTAAISVIFAICLALMAEPRVRAKVRGRKSIKARHLSAA